MLAASHDRHILAQARLSNHYNVATNPLVDPGIRGGRLLTGADFDIEAVRKDKNDNLWSGDEFGPFLMKTDGAFKVPRTKISFYCVATPANPKWSI